MQYFGIVVYEKAITIDLTLVISFKYFFFKLTFNIAELVVIFREKKTYTTASRTIKKENWFITDRNTQPLKRNSKKFNVQNKKSLH